MVTCSGVVTRRLFCIKMTYYNLCCTLIFIAKEYLFSGTKVLFPSQSFGQIKFLLSTRKAKSKMTFMCSYKPRQKLPAASGALEPKCPFSCTTSLESRLLISFARFG